MSQPVNPVALPPAVGYSHGIVAEGAVLALAGQVAMDHEGRVVAPGDIVTQTDRALASLVTVVTAAGGRPQDIVSLTFYVTDVGAYRAARPALGEVWRRHFGRYYPAVTLVGVRELFEEGAVVEIAGLAVLATNEG